MMLILNFEKYMCIHKYAYNKPLFIFQLNVPGVKSTEEDDTADFNKIDQLSHCE